MPQQRAGWLYIFSLPFTALAQVSYNVQPVGRPPIPSGSLSRGYQPPPQLMLLEPPRSRFNSYQPQVYEEAFRTFDSRSHRGRINDESSGLGTHTDPIVITKDFDRDTLEFIEEDKAKHMVEEGPANIVEVKATVSSPDRKIENTVNKAVSTELERAIPAVMNRLQGSMSTMDSELRKELEQALVEELAKNLGNTIDQMETKISDEDLGRLIDVTLEPAQTITTARPPLKAEKPTRWRGSVEETSIIETDLEPNIVTSRPISIINLEEDSDTTTPHREITTRARITISPRPTTIELPHAAITDGREFGFEMENTLPPSMVTLIITTSTTGADMNLFSANFEFFSLGQNRTAAALSTTLSAPYSSTGGALNTMPSSTIPTLLQEPEQKKEKEKEEEEEEEEEEEKSTQVVTKIRPTNFGDENMMRSSIEPEILQEQITTMPEERDMNEVTSTVPAITTVPQATSTGPNISISEVTPSTSLSATSETNLPPFEVIPGVFEEQRTTLAQEELSTASQGAEEMTTTASFLPDEEQLPPDTFIKPKGQCPTPNDKSDRNRTDVLFLLDSSNSFNEHKFMHAIQLILDTVSHFGNIGPDGTQVSLVQYNSEPYLEFSLRKHNCKQWLVDDIADTDYMQVAKKNNLTVLVIATLEANPSYLMELAETAELDAIRVVDDHSVLTIALPVDEEMEQTEKEQEKEEEPKTEAKENAGKTGLETEIGPITTGPLYPAVSSTETETQRMVELECSHLGFKEIHSPNDAGSYSVDFVVATNDCGITRVPSISPVGHNYSLILHLKHHDSLRTGDDRAYLLQCFIGKQLDSSELTADLNIMKGELMIAETISLLSVPPTCGYSIRRDSPDGAIIHDAFVGQTLYHRWECDGGEVDVHQIFRCSSDLSLLSDPKYDDDRLAAYSESKAFAFEGADLLKFPPTCDDSNTSDLLVTRRFRHYSTAMEGALSSALSTKVGMAVNRPPTLQDRVHDLFSTRAASSVIAIVLLIAIIATGK
ncbi:unnamed protein product [Angiostrongylus costaricensis]|uniref:VWFA domain-containing protein n=1 Tax=Angiostrongylus costaricensis TaxID=334426 RepID=A0A158PHW7_ANGCS|nr:unnamed protein product [Angiostrongylus costaricensis]